MTGKTFSIAEQELAVPDSDIRLKFSADPVDYSNCVLRVYGGGSGQYLEAIFNRNGALAGEPKMVEPPPPPEPEPEPEAAPEEEKASG